MLNLSKLTGFADGNNLVHVVRIFFGKIENSFGKIENSVGRRDNSCFKFYLFSPK